MSLTTVFFLPHQPQLIDFYRVLENVHGSNYTKDDINHQYLLTCLLVYKDDEPAGRLCLYYNAAIGKKKTLLFGNLELVNDAFVIEKLMSEAAQYAYTNGYEYLLGPINGSTWDEYRLPLTNESRKFITDLPQPLYYAAHLKRLGYKVIQRYYTRQSTLSHQAIDHLLAHNLEQQGINVRSINLEDYDTELDKLYPFCVNAFFNNVYYSVIDKSDFIEKYKKMQPFLKPEFVLIAENEAKQIVAFLLCLPDRYQPATIVMKTMARNNDTNLRGLMTHMINLFYNRAVAAGYTQLLHAFFHEDNRSGILSEKYNGQPFKSYALFQKKLLD